MSDYVLDRRAASCNRMSDKGVVYELYNYHCDGTVNTAIDTGIKLFDTTAFPKGFVIEMTVTLNTFTTQGSIVRCRTATSPYQGLSTRWKTTDGQIEIQMSAKSITASITKEVAYNYIIGYYPNSSGFWGIDDNYTNYDSVGTINVSNTLCIGGEKDSTNVWKQDRCISGIIHSLKVINIDLILEDNNYPYFEALEENSSVGMTLIGSFTPTLYYSFDKETWTLWDYSSINLPNIGNRVYFYGTSNALSTSDNDYSVFTGSGTLKLGGELPRVVNGRNNGKSFTIYDRAFFRAFENCIALKSIAETTFGIAKKVGSRAFYMAFCGCTSLIDAPKLDFIMGDKECFYSTFKDCINLACVRGALPKANGDSAFESMFEGCSSLIATPIISKSNSGHWYIFRKMFKDCTSLINAPALPLRTTITRSQCAYMYAGCTSLINAPEITATSFEYGACGYMYAGCTSLQYIKCLATNILESNCTEHWVQNVSLVGTFVKNPLMSSWPSGDSGIPSGWTVVDAS